MQFSGAQIIGELLEQQGIKTVIGIPGGANLPIYDALHASRLSHVLARHEQGAGFIAQGMARSTGRAAVCLTTSGPGVTNLLTAIADAKSDSVPIVAITGQVSTGLMGTDAFQEVDTYSLTLPITKHNFLVRKARDLLDVIPESFRIAESGRPGPVVIDVPKDVQTEIVGFERWPEPWTSQLPVCNRSADIEQLVDIIHRAKRPVICVGGGVIASGCAEALARVVRTNSIPIASTLMGLGSYPGDDRLFIGMVGMHGARHTNHILEESDLLLALGMRFDDRATGDAREFCKYALVIHVDIDHSEVDKTRTSNYSIVGDVGAFVHSLAEVIVADRRLEWNSRIDQIRATYPHILPTDDNLTHPVNLLNQVSRLVASNAIITTDVGQHQMWVAQAYPFRHPRTLLTSGGLGTMGFGLPVAIGAALANPDRRVVCVSGDGSFLMNIQELATLAEQNVKVTVIIMNNRHLGLVRQQQELFYGNRVIAAQLEAALDYAAVARAFGIPGYDLGLSTDPIRTLDMALSAVGPNVVNVPIDPYANVYPMVPPGSANRVMIGG